MCDKHFGVYSYESLAVDALHASEAEKICNLPENEDRMMVKRTSKTSASV